MPNFNIASRTDVGRQRQVNEDSMTVFESPNGTVVVVCDGMGGQAAGDVASRLSCEIIRDILTDNTFATAQEAIIGAITSANQGVLHHARQNPSLEGMGSTCVMLIIRDNAVYYGWVGDSRIYYICNNNITQISHDESYVQSLVDSGQLTMAQAEVHPQKNEILNAIGIPGMKPPQVCQMPIIPQPNCKFLLCSDGLSGMVDNETINSIVCKTDVSLNSRADMLVDMANQNGGTDNITVQLVEFPQPRPVVSPVNTVEEDADEESPITMVEETPQKSGSWKYILITVVLLFIGAAAAVFLYSERKDAAAQQKKQETSVKKKKKKSARKKKTDSGKMATMTDANKGIIKSATTRAGSEMSADISMKNVEAENKKVEAENKKVEAVTKNVQADTTKPAATKDAATKEKAVSDKKPATIVKKEKVEKEGEEI